MATYALKFDGVDDRVDLPNYSTTGLGGGTGHVEMEILFSPPATPATTTDKLFGNTTGSGAGSTTGGTYLLQYSPGDGEWLYLATPTNADRRIFPTFVADDPDSIYKFRTYYDESNGSLEAYLSVNGGSETIIGTETGITNALYTTQLGISLGWQALGPYGEMTLHGFNLSISGNDVRSYDPDASNGTGNTLIDTTGGQDATLGGGFATDDSQWVLYGLPDVTELPRGTMNQSRLFSQIGIDKGSINHRSIKFFKQYGAESNQYNRSKKQFEELT